MKAFKRFLILFSLLIFVFIFNHFRSIIFTSGPQKPLKENDFYRNSDLFDRKPLKRRDRSACSMSTCFDFTRCRETPLKGLSVHVYPRVGNDLKISESFLKIKEIIEKSVYFEENAEKACLFLNTLWDPLDRDPLSRDFQKPSPSMTSFEPLFKGQNHVVFNLYTGSWPKYAEMDFSFTQNYGKIDEILKKGIFVKASQSRDHYRRDFDVSLPLIAKNHVKRGPQFVSHESQQNVGSRSSEALKSISDEKNAKKRKNLLVFKGKRYIYGIGSETRNSLHHLNNGNDVIILTTCRHGKKWKELKDEDCDKDDHNYDKFDYLDLMSNSTFCLIPRGRRLGSYRFLEALKIGCIPVILSNNWILPFEELIDWSECSVKADERLVLQIPDILRQIPNKKIIKMKQKCLLLFERFFASLETIVFTSLIIIHNRILPHLALQNFLFQIPNDSPLVQKQLQGLPLDQSQLPTCRTRALNDVTFIIHVQSAQHVPAVERVFERVSKHVLTKEMVVLWSVEVPIPQKLIQSPKTRVLKTFKALDKFSVSIETEAVFQLSPQSVLLNEEISFAFQIFKSFSNRIIGFDSRDHFYSNEKRHLEFTSKWTNQYSSVTLDAALYHRDFNQLFAEFVERNHALNASLANQSECLDMAFVFFVSHVTREGPLKVSQRKKSSEKIDSFSDFETKRRCFETVFQFFEYLPLIRSQIRFDPLLYKDLVSIKRKKYRKMELI